MTLRPLQKQSSPPKIRPPSSRARYASLIFLTNCEMFDDFHEFLQFLDSIIVGSGGPRGLAHGLQLVWVGSQGAHGVDNFRGTVGISGHREPPLNSQRHNV